MSTTNLSRLYKKMDSPSEEINLTRRGISASLVKAFLEGAQFNLEDVLRRLRISRSTFFAKRKHHPQFNSEITEKFLRLMRVSRKAEKILGEKSHAWIYETVPSLGNQCPIDLLDTEAGHRLVEDVLLRMEFGIYG